MGQDNQPTEAGLEAPSLRWPGQAVKQWAARLARALLALGEAVSPAVKGAASQPPPWRITWCLAPGRGSPRLRPADGAEGAGIAVWLDVGPAAHPRACRGLAQALRLEPRATLLWPGIAAEQLAATIAAACALPQVACVVLDGRDAEHQVARSLGQLARSRGIGQATAGAWAPLTVLAHFCPPGAPGGANLPSKWPKLDHLRGIA